VQEHALTEPGHGEHRCERRRRVGSPYGGQQRAVQWLGEVEVERVSGVELAHFQVR